MVPPRLGDRRQQQRGVDVAVVVGGEDDGRGSSSSSTAARRSASRSSPSTSGSATTFTRPRNGPATISGAGRPGRRPAGPLGVVVGARVLLLRRHARRRRGTVGARHGKPPPGDAAGARDRHRARHRLDGAVDAIVPRGDRRSRSRHVGHEDRRVVQVGDRRVAADDVASPSRARRPASTPA